MTDKPAIEVGLCVVHPWLCDAMGHLTTRHYMGFFDDASYQLFAALGFDPRQGAVDGIGWADVRHEIEYRGEVAAGAVLRIEGRITRLGNSSLSHEYALLDRATGDVCATLVAQTVCFDLHQRRSRPLPEAFRQKAQELF